MDDDQHIEEGETDSDSNQIEEEEQHNKQEEPSDLEMTRSNRRRSAANRQSVSTPLQKNPPPMV
jgi:hypothetical protein